MPYENVHSNEYHFIQSIHDFNLIAVHDYLKTIAGFIS